MSQYLSRYVAIIEFLREKEGMGLDAAMERAGVPDEMRDPLAKYFSEPIEILEPAMLTNSSAGTILRCIPRPEDTPGYYWGTQRDFLINARHWNKSVVGNLG